MSEYHMKEILDEAHQQRERAERAEAECERLRTLADHMKAALEFIAEEHDAGRHDGLPELCPAHDEYVMWKTASEALATPPPEGEPDTCGLCGCSLVGAKFYPVEFLGLQVAVCPDCAEREGGSTDAPHTPEQAGWYCAHCERGVDPSEVTFHEAHEACGRIITDDLPPDQAHGDALAALDELAAEALEGYDNEGPDQIRHAYLQSGVDCIRQALTASGVPEDGFGVEDVVRWASWIVGTEGAAGCPTPSDRVTAIAHAVVNADQGEDDSDPLAESGVPGHWACKNPGRADQYRAEAMACRRALGFDAESHDVSPTDLTSAIADSGVPEDTETCPYGHCQLQFRVRVPEEVRRLPENMKNHADRLNDAGDPSASGHVMKWAEKVEAALASAPGDGKED